MHGKGEGGRDGEGCMVKGKEGGMHGKGEGGRDAW